MPNERSDHSKIGTTPSSWSNRGRQEQETPFVYRPHAESGERFIWDETVRAAMKDYNRLDLSI